MVDEPPKICWVCGKQVPPLESTPDEFGFFAHWDCLQLPAEKKIKRAS